MTAEPAGVAPRPGGGGSTDHTISLARANLLGIPFFLAVTAILVLPAIAAGGIGPFVLGVSRYSDLRVVAAAVVLGTVAHEFFHGLGWVLAGRKPFGAVQFGFHWKTLTPYAHFTEPISARAYRIGVVLPGILVGLVPATAGYVLPEPALILFGGIFSGAAAGDLLSLLATRRIPGDVLVIDHPSRVGCLVWEPPGATPTASSG